MHKRREFATLDADHTIRWFCAALIGWLVFYGFY